MKRINSVLLFLFVLMTVSVSADDSSVWWGSNYLPGNMRFGGTIGYESGTLSDGGSLSAISLVPEGEIFLYKPDFGDIAPMDLGLAVKGHIGFGFSDDTMDSSLSAGLGVFGTFHVGFRGIGSHFTDYKDTPSALFSGLENFDYFLEAGLVFDLLTYDDRSMIGFGGTTGLRYFLNDSFSVTLSGTYWNGMGGGAIGASIKLGPSPSVKALDIALPGGKLDLSPLYMQLYLTQFYSIYWYSFYAGGFYFNDSNYKEGQGTVWSLKSGDDDELLVERALLKINSDGSRWWKIKYSSDSDEIIYEFLLDSSYKLLKLRFRDLDTGDVREYKAEPEELEKYTSADMREISEGDYSKYSEGIVRVTTKAGSFDANYLKYEEVQADYSYEWWVTDTVPGTLVRFNWRSGEDTMTGELIEITKANRTELGSF